MTENPLDFIENYRRVRRLFWGSTRPTVRMVSGALAIAAPIERIKTETPGGIEASLSDNTESLTADPLEGVRAVIKIAVERRTWPLKPKEIAECVSSTLGVPLESIQGARGPRVETMARHLTYWWVRRERGLTFAQIARIYGGREPATVKYAIRQIEKLIEDFRIDLDTN